MMSMGMEAFVSRKVTLGSPERFGYEWKEYSEVLAESKQQLTKWLGSTSLDSFAGKTVLDVGCGMGRNSFWIAQAGAKSVTSVDVDDNSLKSARKNLSDLPNVTVKKCSAYDLNSKDLGFFDRVICIGVLHHLSDPEDALSKMWQCVAPGGELILWCYGKNGNEAMLPAIQAFRWIGSRLPIKASHILSKAIARSTWPLFRRLPWKVEYYRNLRNFSFENFESIIFDQILPRIAHYWTKEDMEKIVKPLGGKAKVELVQGNSWSVRVKKDR